MEISENMKMSKAKCGYICAIAILFLCTSAANGDNSSESLYPMEDLPSECGYQDEAFSDLRISFSKWPDCYSNKTAIADIFRIEGVADARGEQKALALWKWFRILVASAGGGYTYEDDGDVNGETLVHDPHKIFTVYGHHMCDGLSWAMTALWRSAGYIAFDSCTEGHTVASLRYKDSDGQYRFHDFDPVGRFYFWDDTHKRVGTWGIPIMKGRVHRHLTSAQKTHTLERGLKTGETITLKWENEGNYIPTGVQGRQFSLDDDYQKKYYTYSKGRENGVYAVAGEEIQNFETLNDPLSYKSQLDKGSANTFCEIRGSSIANPVLHPEKSGIPSVFIYRISSPYVAIDGKVESIFFTANSDCSASLSLSRDNGKTWKQLYSSSRKAGHEQISIDIGLEARKKDKPNIVTGYSFLLKAEFLASEGTDPAKTGMDGLKVSAVREFNKRTLPNFREGINTVAVNARKNSHDSMLELVIRYSVEGQERTVRKTIAEFPFYFNVDNGEMPELPLSNYDESFNNGRIKMGSIELKAVSAGGKVADQPLQEIEAIKDFMLPFPHPADLKDCKMMKTVECDIRQTNGFLPQSTLTPLFDEDKMKALVEQFRNGKTAERWKAAEELGNYPASIDALVQEISTADADLLFFICKALAVLKDKKAIEPLLERWKEAPRGSPGMRYVPDVLASIGDQSLAKEIAAPLEKVRFDFRFHIAFAMKTIGGEEARGILRKIAEEDPFPAVRQFALESLADMNSNENINIQNGDGK